MTEENKTEEPKKIIDDEDYDFDFSRYEKEEKEQTELNIFAINKPKVSSLKSRFSNGELSLNRLAEIDNLMTKYSIKTGCYEQDINMLRKFKAIMDEYWENINSMVGQYHVDQITKIRKKCTLILIKNYPGRIPFKVHHNLLFYRKCLYNLRQFLNLGIEVEFRRNSVFGSARNNIVQ
jgi:hypothetical protein